jgi:hypothetical protein
MKNWILILLFIIMGIISGCSDGSMGVTEGRNDTLKNVKFEIVNNIPDMEIKYEAEGSGLGSKRGTIKPMTSEVVGEIMDSTLSGLYLKKLKVYSGEEEIYSYDVNKNEKDIVRVEEEEKAVFKITKEMINK